MTDRFWDWLQHGIEQGYCGPIVCLTHDGPPTTAVEDEEMEYGYDPCISVIRPYDSADTKSDVEDNHSPSIWRRTNSQPHESSPQP